MDWGKGHTYDAPHDRRRVRTVGPRALLVEVAGADEARMLADWIRGSSVRCEDVVPAAGTVLLDGLSDVDEARRMLGSWTVEDVVVTAGELVRIPVRYDGEDLDRVAEVWGVSRDEVVARHTGCEFLAAFTGFAPGFSYLSGLPPAWAVGRLDSPRPRVPAGAVALADTWCGIYPSDSPGGWLLLGRTDVVLWDLDRSGGPALLAPGTRVRFEVA